MDTNEQALVQVAAAPLAAPSAAVAGLVAASIADNTKRTYAAALKRLDAALEGQDLTDASLAVYIASLHAAGLSPAVAAMAVASVKFRCRLQGQVDGVRFSEVDTAAAVAANDSGSVAGLRDAALLAVASDGLLRVSEIAALDVGDVQAEADGSGRLVVGESKTDQEGRGAVLYLGALTVTRVNAWLAAAGHQDGPLFRRVRRGGRVEDDPGRRLSVNAIRQIIRSRAAAVGIEGRVSGHSLRVGGSHRRCRATMHGASWQHGAPSLASATVADKGPTPPGVETSKTQIRRVSPRGVRVLGHVFPWDIEASWKATGTGIRINPCFLCPNSHAASVCDSTRCL